MQEGALHDAHRDAMAMAQKKGLGITVHAAEAGPGSVAQAVVVAVHQAHAADTLLFMATELLFGAVKDG